jgi:Domain of unknown function (DUF222)
MNTSFAAARDCLSGIARDFDPLLLTGDDARAVVAELGVIRRLTDALLAKAAKRVQDRTSKSQEDAAAVMARTLGVKPGEVRSAIGTAAQLENFPATDAEAELLAAAELGLVPLRDACIAARAAVEDPDARRKRQERSRELRMWTDVDGMVAGRFRLTPEVGGQVKKTIDAQVQKIFRARKAGEHEPHAAYGADALADFVLNNTDPETKRDPNATVHVIIDHDALVRGNPEPGETCEIPGVGPVNVAWVRELLGSAFLTAIIKRGKDILTVAHFGRHIPAVLQTALIVQGWECRIEGCYHRGYLERDHVHDHAKGGATSLDNIEPRCSREHRLKSAGWILGPRNPQTGKRKLFPPARK